MISVLDSYGQSPANSLYFFSPTDLRNAESAVVWREQEDGRVVVEVQHADFHDCRRVDGREAPVGRPYRQVVVTEAAHQGPGGRQPGRLVVRVLHVEQTFKIYVSRTH